MIVILKKQKGYLLIVAVILIFIFSLVGSLLAKSYMRKGSAVMQEQQAQQALYIATSGIEMVKRAIIEDQITCANVTGDSQFTNASLLGGRVTVTGTESSASSYLTNGISASGNSLTLSNASGFTSEGVVFIGSEKIGYYSKSGNTLQNLKRGLGGTTAASHSSSAAVSQSDCLLSATGAMPDFTNVQGRREVQEVVSSQSSGGGTLSADTPVVMSAGSVTLRGTADLYNKGVTTSSAEYAGANVRSGGSISLSGSPVTYVSDGSGGTTQSSTASNIQSDIAAFDGNITSSNLYSYYFSEPLTTISSIADHSYNKNNIDGVAGKTVWIGGDLKFTGNSTYNIGTSSQPVVLIIDGDYEQKGNTTVNLYGLMYVTGDLDITGTADLAGEGAMAIEGEADIGGTGFVDLNPSALGDLSLVNPYMNGTTTYSVNLLRRINV